GMQFAAGPHGTGEIRLHRRTADGRKGNQLEADGANRLDAIACPLRAGAATFHHHRTLHATGPNTSAEPRVAFIMEFQLPPQRCEGPVPRPWFEEHRAISARGL